MIKGYSGTFYQYLLFSVFCIMLSIEFETKLALQYFFYTSTVTQKQNVFGLFALNGDIKWCKSHVPVASH